MVDFAREIRRENNGSDYVGRRDGTRVWIRKGCGFFGKKTHHQLGALTSLIAAKMR